MQNWNEGKTQEFKERKVYNIENSKLKRIQTMVEEAKAQAEGTPVVAKDARTLLFVGATCPNCKVAVQLLDKAGIAYESVMSQENMDLCREYGVMATPTLVITDGENTEKYAGAQAIKQFVKSEQVG